MNGKDRSIPLPKRTDIVVIGAGLSGLWAAVCLKKYGHTVDIIEARDRVGGRIHSVSRNGVIYELGAQWIGPTQNRIYSVCQELGLEIFPTAHDGRKILEMAGRIRQYSGTIPRLNPIALLELHRAISRLESDIQELDSVSVFSGHRIARLDTQTVGEWARRNIRTRSVRAVLNTAVQVIFGTEVDELSLFYFLRYCKAGGGLMKLCEIENAAQQDRIRAGAQEIAHRIVERHLSGSVHLSAPVRRIEQDSEGVRIRTDRGLVEAKRVIIAIAPPLAARIDYQPPLSAGRDRLTQRMPMGSTIKCHARYATPFWRERGWSGEVVSDGHPLTVVFDNSVPDSSWALLGFIVGADARRWGRESDLKRKDAVLEAFARYFGPEALEPIEYIDHDWGDEEWSRGCPIAFAPPGVLSVDGDSLWQPQGLIHWAGTETATEWMGFMEGALQAGERAALEVDRELT